MIGRDAGGDDGERGRADEASPRHRAALLDRYRVEHGQASLDRERQDQARRVVGEQIGQVLLDLCVCVCVLMPELSEGPFCVTRYNPTHQLTDP